MLHRYQFLAFDFGEQVDISKENCRLLLIRLKMEGWMISRSKVFLKYYNEEYLSRLYETQVRKIIKIQSMLRAFLACKKLNKAAQKKKINETNEDYRRGLSARSSTTDGWLSQERAKTTDLLELEVSNRRMGEGGKLAVERANTAANKSFKRRYWEIGLAAPSLELKVIANRRVQLTRGQQVSSPRSLLSKLVDVEAEYDLVRPIDGQRRFTSSTRSGRIIDPHLSTILSGRQGSTKGSQSLGSWEISLPDSGIQVSSMVGKSEHVANASSRSIPEEQPIDVISILNCGTLVQ
ncbi:Similar to ninaC: Neither inactivation nor afterpotential protein C (Drosophila melanogaster) [Cotesia congregata]|uniref:Similar to ninaC: Neither inactivation nor afterpotential protein C (Drosophila melanogaster) n=1 Tax=Cotesia congregata TaxID=51543 RepID=A0A8J2MNU4_COTCN|nr:Similar to ninaC: Neither inactivation nor afterpotential protein C (Drosophila melanogaster) [Cotesia congregata]